MEKIDKESGPYTSLHKFVSFLELPPNHRYIKAHRWFYSI
jgi:hypothetical protein